MPDHPKRIAAGIVLGGAVLAVAASGAWALFCALLAAVGRAEEEMEAIQ